MAAQPPAEAQPTEPQEEKDAPAPAKKEGEPVRSVKQGALTLLILPPAEVFLNGRSLGKTPLFNAPVPVGRHLLRIKGEDGKLGTRTIRIRRSVHGPVVMDNPRYALALRVAGLERMSWAASSLPSDFVSAIRPALDAE